MDQYQELLSRISSPLATLFLIDRIQNTWSSIIQELEMKDIEFQVPKDWSTNAYCNFCFVPVFQEENKLTHKQKLYHSSCANFWNHYNKLDD